MRNYEIDENKKKNEINKLKEDYRSTKQNKEGMKGTCQEKLESKESELENFNIVVAKVEAFTGMLMKEEHKKEI